MKRFIVVLGLLVALVVPCTAKAQQCDTIQVPWHESFDTIGLDSLNQIVPIPLSQCWIVRQGDSSYAQIFSNELRVLMLTNDNFIIALPPVALPPDSVYFRFHVRYSGNLEIAYGVMTDSTDTNSFVFFDYVPVEANSGYVELDFSTLGTNITGDVRLAFKIRSETYAFVFLDNIYIDRAAGCQPPSDVWLAAVDTTSVTLQWNYNTLSAGYLLTLDDTLTFYTTDTLLTFDSLEPNHLYNYTIQSRCYAGELTPIVQGTFRTACLPMELPYYENFPYTIYEMPDCWQVLHGLQWLDATHTVPSNYVGAYGPDHSLRFRSVTDTESVVISPLIAHPANRLHIGFDIVQSSESYMEVGMVFSSQDMSSFVPLATFVGEETNSLIHYDVYTETVEDTSYGFVAFRWVASGLNREAFIDNVLIEVADSCHKPTDVHAEDVGPHYVTLAWVDNSLIQTGYEVRYATVDNIDSAVHVYYTNNYYIAIDSLQVNAGYWFWVRSLCGDTSEWVATGMVRTECGMPELPFYENFESYQMGDIVQCWDYYITNQLATQARQPQVYSAADYSHSGHNTWEFPNPYNDTVMAVLPTFGINPMALELSFWLWVGYGKFEIGFYDLTTNMFTPVVVKQAINGVLGTDGEQVVIQCDTVAAANAFSRFAFRWSRVTSSSYAPYRVAYIDDLRVRRIPLCHAPDSITVYNIEDSSAMVQIHDSWGTGIYSVVYTTENMTDTVVVFGNNVTITNLNHSSYYSIAAKGVCYDATLTDEVTNSFATRCHIITHDDMPYLETFDSYTEDNRLSPCWNRLSFNPYFPNYPYAYQGVYYGGGSAGVSMQFLLNSMSNFSNSELLILPEVDYLEDLYLEFDVRTNNSFARVRVGVMTDPYDTSTFFTVSTPAMDAGNINVWKHIVVPFNEYFGTGRHVAIGAYAATTIITGQVYVDNVKLSLIPQCSDSLSWLTVSDVGESCASLSWNASIGRNENAVFVVHLLDSAGIELRTDTTSNEQTLLCNLVDGESYRAYVELYCGDTVVATTTNQVGFTTRCLDNSTIIVGTSGTSSATNYPIATNYHISQSEQIYRVSEMQYAAGTITSFSINVVSGAIQDIAYSTIYMGLTSDTSLTEWVPLANMTLVYEGPVNLSPGWNNISLSTPFHLNGSDNLVVAFVTTMHDNIVNLPHFSIRQVFDGASLFTYSGYAGSNPISTRNRNIMRFYYCPDLVDICAPPNITSATSTDFTITVSYNSDVPCEVHIVRGWWNRAFVGVMDSTNTHTFTGLEPNTQYTVGVRKHCSNGEISLWSIRRITTVDVMALPPTFVEVEDVGYDHASVIWRPRGSETHWQVRLFNTLVDTIVALTDTTYTFDSLLSRITYNVSVRSMCGSDYSLASPWSDTVSFTTDYCHPASNLAVSNVTMTSAHVTWEPSPNGISYKVEYGYEGFQRGDAVASYVVNNATAIDFDTLVPGNNYNVYVAAICGPGMNSVWIGTNPFHTPADAGISATPNGDGFVVYPNPASSFVTVKLDADDPEARIAIIDQQGRTVAESTGQMAVIDISHLSAGIYFVRLSGTSYSAVKKLIVK